MILVEVDMRIEYCIDTLNKIEEGVHISTAALKIGEAAALGMLFEAAASPSLGLVSPYSNGCHKDMDYFTFLRSTSSIAGIMPICAQIGIDYEKDLLPKLRAVGMYGEKNMFNSTKGVNTHKGALFLLGIISCAAGRCLNLSIDINRQNMAKQCSIIADNIVERELETINEDTNINLSNGERIYKKYGIKGIRGEVQNGMPSVINIGLPMYEDAKQLNLSESDCLVNSLLGIMSCAEDTTVINRCGIKGYIKMKEMAKKAIDLGAMKTCEGKKFVQGMDRLFIDNNISPGGAADLLAATVMIYNLERYDIK